MKDGLFAYFEAQEAAAAADRIATGEPDVLTTRKLRAGLKLMMGECLNCARKVSGGYGALCAPCSAIVDPPKVAEG